MTERSSLLDKLKAVHEFPGSYVFKVIGTNSPEFISRVVQAAVIVLGEPSEISISTRESSGGKHLSVTLTVEVHEAEAVLDIYELLRVVEGVRFLL
ncbi:MAG: DUF493 domain-containing protein [Bradymonadaceae bacterium]|nr:DUF493 domain-containing protein [Lujinxingiaceae bacterium]